MTLIQVEVALVCSWKTSMNNAFVYGCQAPKHMWNLGAGRGYVRHVGRFRSPARGASQAGTGRVEEAASHVHCTPCVVW